MATHENLSAHNNFDTHSEQLRKFGATIRQFRLSRGLTQSELADQSKLDRKTISRIENHQYSPSLTSIFSIAKALSVDPEDLLK